MQNDVDSRNTMTHRVLVRCTLPDGQVIRTHVDIPLQARESEERAEAWARALARTWVRNWTKIEPLEVRPLAPEERWRRGIDPDPATRAAT